MDEADFSVATGSAAPPSASSLGNLRSVHENHYRTVACPLECYGGAAFRRLAHAVAVYAEASAANYLPIDDELLLGLPGASLHREDSPISRHALETVCALIRES